jgi:hypothetical protein
MSCYGYFFFVQVSYDRWFRAQSGEYNTWVNVWRGYSDDRGNEHTVGFGWYSALPFDLGILSFFFTMKCSIK